MDERLKKQLEEANKAIAPQVQGPQPQAPEPQAGLNVQSPTMGDLLRQNQPATDFGNFPLYDRKYSLDGRFNFGGLVESFDNTDYLDTGDDLFSFAGRNAGRTSTSMAPQVQEPQAQGTMQPTITEPVATQEPQVGVPPMLAPQAPQSPEVGLTSPSGMPLNEFLEGGIDQSKGLFRAPEQMAGRGKTLSTEEWDALSQQRMAEIDRTERFREAGRMGNFAVQKGIGRELMQPTSGISAPTAPQQVAAVGGGTTAPTISDSDYRDMANARQRGASAEDIARGMKVANRLGVDITGAPLQDNAPTAREQELQDLEIERRKQVIEKGNQPDATPIEKKAAGLARLADQGVISQEEFDSAIRRETMGGPESLSEIQQLSTDLDRQVESGIITREQANQAIRRKVLGEGERSSEREKRVEQLQQTLGFSPAQALSLVEGVDRIVTDPNTGSTVVYNQATGESTPLDLNPELMKEVEKLSQPNQSQGGGLYGLVNEDITGIIPGFAETMQGVTGSLPGVAFNVVNPENTEARQQLRTAVQTLGRALAENPRFSEGEQQRIRKEVDIAPAAFNDPQTLKAKMRSINRSLSGRVNDYLEIASSKATPTKDRQDAIRKITTIRNFLDDLGVPEEGDENNPLGLDDETKALIEKYTSSN